MTDAESLAKGQHGGRKTLVLCLDGTGNKFHGNEDDSSILKIYKMLDREDVNQHTYYQPGIGTYVQNASLMHTGRYARIKSWYLKAKDQAVGSSFADHVMGAYKFLMRYYQSGDDIYLFGFSRGAYTARFLAEMLDYVGLLSAGNEEMARFAWKAFALWQQRSENTEVGRKKKDETYEFLNAFRETFSRPVRRIRFLGLFDTVNSVPTFEGAWLRRTKFPYTANSSAKVIRHAVSIDERRAKFRSDLVSAKAPSKEIKHPYMHRMTRKKQIQEERPALQRNHHSESHHRFRSRRKPFALYDGFMSAQASQLSVDSMTAIGERLNEDEEDEKAPQDIVEVWFPGDHGDIGGGWPLNEGERVSITHVPLVWMLREARKAGLPFDETKLAEANYIFDDFQPNFQSMNATKSTIGGPPLPQIELDGVPTTALPKAVADTELEKKRSEFMDLLTFAWTKSRKHDALLFNNGKGISARGTLSWKMMEWLPFTRMDLQPDGSWKPINWPLPRGETRDIPDDAWIHHSAIKRMEADPTYRPGNLIIGGGGRGIRVAPASADIGEWMVLKDEGDVIGEVVVRKKAFARAKTG